MTKEAFVSIIWRLIPYWLNNWEQQWGAECLSMLFELPHYALELLVILPLVQVCFCLLSCRVMLHVCMPSFLGTKLPASNARPCDCMQIICARLKLLAMPHGRGLVDQLDVAPEGEDVDDVDALAPNILSGTWHADPAQRCFLPRLRCSLICLNSRRMQQAIG